MAMGTKRNQEIFFRWRLIATSIQRNARRGQRLNSQPCGNEVVATRMTKPWYKSSRFPIHRWRMGPHQPRVCSMTHLIEQLRPQEGLRPLTEFLSAT